MSAASTDTKNQTQAANIITIRLPASCPLFRYTLNQEFGSTASHSLPAGFQVPSVTPGPSQQPGAGVSASAGATSGQADPVQQAPVQPVGEGQGGTGTGPSGQQQPAPGTGGDLPTHTSGQAPPPTDQPSPQRKRQEQQYRKRQDSSGQGGGAGGIPVVREGEQPPFSASPRQDQGLAGGAPPIQPVAAPVTIPSTGQAASPQNPPNIPKGADSGWLGVNQAAAHDSSTAKQLQGQVGQIQVLPFPSTSTFSHEQHNCSAISRSVYHQ